MSILVIQSGKHWESDLYNVNELWGYHERVIPTHVESGCKIAHMNRENKLVWLPNENLGDCYCKCLLIFFIFWLSNDDVFIMVVWRGPLGLVVTYPYILESLIRVIVYSLLVCLLAIHLWVDYLLDVSPVLWWDTLGMFWIVVFRYDEGRPSWSANLHDQR